VARERIDLYLDDTVAPGSPSVELLNVVPNGQVWRIMHFGGAAAYSGIIAFQVYAGTEWKTVRATAGPGQGDDFLIDRDFTGNGTIRFRIVRQNLHTASQQMVAWLEAFKRA